MARRAPDAAPTAQTPAEAREAALPHRAGREIAQRKRKQLAFLLAGGASLLAVVLIVIAATVVNNSQASACASAEGALSCGSQAPDFTLTDVASNAQVSLSAQQGHPVLLELFATWCPHCRHETQVLKALYRKNHPQGLQVLSVVANQFDHSGLPPGNINPTSPGDLQWFARNFAIPYHVLWDPNVASALLSQQAIYKLRSYPTIYILDKKGIIRYSGAGEVPQADLQAQIAKVL